VSLKRNIYNSLAALALAASTAPACAEELFYLFGHTGKVVPASKIAQPTEAQKAKAKQLKASNITWNITYEDTTAGFEHASLGATRKATLEAVLEYISSVLNHPGTSCDLVVAESVVIGGATLAQCGAAIPIVNGYDAGEVFHRLANNTNRFGGADMELTVDFTTWNWNSDLGSPTPSEFDLFTVLLHEITHALGIASLTNPNGTSYFSTLPAPNPTAVTFTSWDNLLQQSSGNLRVWDASTRAFQLAANGLNQGDNTIRFNGTNATSSLGQAPPIYTPNPYQSGSSVSHWQLTSPIPSNAVMRPSVANGVSNRTYQAFEIQALKDLGYSLAASAVADWNVY